MTDGRALARVYLEQQQALGTNEVVLSGATPPPVPEPHRTVGRAGGQADAAAARDRPTVRPPDRPKAPTPPVAPPPAGLSYDAPSGDLFTDDPIQRTVSLEDVATLVRDCTKCRLCDSRTNAVPGEGPADARLVAVGEGPGRVEDETGRPFVGQAGELLTKILGAIGLRREQVFICNVVKCRPPENRTPQYDEAQACAPYLFRQLELIKPKVILAMGGTAAQALLNTRQSLGALRNQIHRFRGIPVIVTYHPAALLRNPNWKKPTWDDVRIARRLLD